MIQDPSNAEAGGKFTSKEREQLKEKIEEDGYKPHPTKESCTFGCRQCCKYRRLVNWPDDMPLFRSPSIYKQSALEKLCEHYGLSLSEGNMGELPPMLSENLCWFLATCRMVGGGFWDDRMLVVCRYCDWHLRRSGVAKSAAAHLGSSFKFPGDGY